MTDHLNGDPTTIQWLPSSPTFHRARLVTGAVLGAGPSPPRVGTSCPGTPHRGGRNCVPHGDGTLTRHGSSARRSGRDRDALARLRLRVAVGVHHAATDHL